jgi:DNA-damage-inducible protein J
MNITVRVDDDVKKEAEILFEKLGLTISGAINVFFRQAIREQAIPFQVRVADDYFTGENLARIKRSMAQAERGEIISFTVAELKAMEAGNAPQRAIDFLEKHKGECIRE